MEYITALLILVNSARTNPLKLDKDLTIRAQSRAEYLCTHEFSHTGWKKWVKGRGGFLGENLAENFPDATSTHNALMVSPKHKENIVNSNYTEVGIGHACNVTVELFN